MTKPREKAVRKIADNYHKMSSEQQDKAAEMVERLVKNDPDFKGERLDNEQYEEDVISRLQDPNLSDNHREIILNDPNLSDKQREILQDISDEALDYHFSAQQLEQQALVDDIAPQLVDILNELDTDNYQGTNRTIEFNKDQNQLSLIDNATGASLMTAQWHPNEKKWENKGSFLTEDDRNQIQKAWEQVEHQQQQDTKVGLKR
jgi:hypothetical protein